MKASSAFGHPPIGPAGAIEEVSAVFRLKGRLWVSLAASKANVGCVRNAGFAKSRELPTAVFDRGTYSAPNLPIRGHWKIAQRQLILWQVTSLTFN